MFVKGREIFDGTHFRWFRTTFCLRYRNLAQRAYCAAATDVTECEIGAAFVVECFRYQF